MLQFNPTPIVRLIPIPGHKPCVVVDDFLRDPESLVAYAKDNLSRFATPAINAFPGIELRMPDDFSARLNDFFIQHVRKPLDVRRSLSMYSRLSMVTLQPDQLAPHQRICHQDHLPDNPEYFYAACVLYLFNNPAMGGTSFFVPSNQVVGSSAPAPDEDPDAAPAYITRSTRDFGLLGTVAAAWNRAIFYDGTIFHSAHIDQPALLDARPDHGRLTMNGFFTCKRAGG